MFGAKKAAVAGRRTDQETEPTRILKLKECCDMLLAGGYFRVRIPTLSPFDKVVGGMVWSLTASNVEVDVDIIFQENSTIGQRIKLSEQLVRALISIKCPSPLQAQQIQGLDYDALILVIRWLVRKVLETRQLTGDLIRHQSVQQFSKSYHFPEEGRSEPARLYLAELDSHHKPQRVFKLTSEMGDATARTTATLMEYGERLSAQTIEDEEAEEKRQQQQQQRQGGGQVGAAIKGKLASALGGGDGKEKDDSKKKDEAKRQAAEAEQKRLDAIKDQLSQVEGQGLKMESVQDFVGMQADAIRQATADYEASTQQEMESKEAQGRHSAAQGHQRQVDALNRKITEAKTTAEKKLEKYKASAKKFKLLQAMLQKKLAYKERIVRETGKLEDLENQAENKEILGKLRALVMLNESLKSQEAAFKANCKQQRAELTEMLRKIEGGEVDDETKRMLEIEKIWARDMEKLDKLRQVLAKKNQEIARINRLIDEIPTRAELIQYERRFVELYEMVAEKLGETRKYFAMYNTLDESHGFMSQEVKLLNSVVEQFPTAMKSKGGREAFLSQFQKILASIEQQKEQVEKDYQREKSALDAMKEKYGALLEKQRNYFKAVKEFQDECTKNEKLAAGLERLQRALSKRQEE